MSSVCFMERKQSYMKNTEAVKIHTLLGHHHEVSVNGIYWVSITMFVHQIRGQHCHVWFNSSVNGKLPVLSPICFAQKTNAQ